MVKMTPYLNLPNAKKAIDLYQKIFDAKLIDRRPFTKEQAPPGGFPPNFDLENSTMYALMEILGQQVHMSDAQGNLSPMGMVDIYMELDNEEQINKIYKNATDAGCKINVPLGKQFWGAIYTNFKDPIGLTWQLSAAPSQVTTTSKAPEEPAKEEKPKETTKKTVKKATSSPKKTAKKSTKKP